MKSIRGSEIGCVPAKWIKQKWWYYTSTVLIRSQNASCILLGLVTQLSDRERLQLSPFKYYPIHAERCISIFYSKINPKQTAPYVRDSSLNAVERRDGFSWRDPHGHLFSFAFGVGGLKHAGGGHEVLYVLPENLVLWFELKVLLFYGIHTRR